MERYDFGVWAEEQAARYYSQQGWQLLDRRVRFRGGEIDLIFENEETLLFVEVKARRSARFGHVVESMNAKKVERLYRTIFLWRMREEDFRPGRLLFLGVYFKPEGALDWIEEFIDA